MLGVILLSGWCARASDEARASAVRASHVRKTAMLVVYPARSRATWAAPVGGKKEVIPGTFAATNNNGVTVYGRDKAVVECVEGRVSVVARFALVEGEELRGCGCLNVGCYDDVG